MAPIRFSMRVLVGLVVLLGPVLSGRAVASESRPNIVVFLVDDLGWQDTSVPFHTRATVWNQRYRTPNMERLAAAGMKFTQAYSCTVCSPTRVSLMTGLSAARHRVTNWLFRKDTSTDARHPSLDLPDWNVNGLSPVPGVPRTVHAAALPALLKRAGYRTIHVGKAHFGAIGTPGADPTNLGFDVNVAGHALGGPGSYLGTQGFGADTPNAGRIWAVPGLQQYHGKDVFLTEALTLEANKAVDKAVADGKPFFLYMAHYAVHVPYAPDRRFFAKYREAGLDPTEAMYAALIEGMDKSLGDILANVERHGQADRTIVLFTSDNGGLSAQGRGGAAHTHNKPLSSGKGSAHEGGIRVPMIVKWPGVAKAGSQCNRPVIIEDFFPTVLEMAGVTDYRQVGGVIDGVSFVPLLKQAGAYPHDRPLFWHYPDCWGPTGPGIGPSSTIRRGDWKLIYYHADQRYELFNLAEDLGEQDNRAAKEPAIRAQLAAELGRFLAAVGAQMPRRRADGKPVPLPGSEKPSSPQSEKGLAGYWSFDENQGQEARDSSGRKHHGRIKGGVKWVPGRVGAALEFNGADAMVEIADGEGLNLEGDMTFMAWVRAVADDGRDRLLFGDTAGLAVNRNLSIGLDRGALFVGHGTGPEYESLSPSLKFDGAWKHLAILFEHPKCYLYVNGLLHEVTQLALPLSRTRGGGRCIGGWWAGYLRGTLDEVRLYNRALTEREIRLHAQSPDAPTGPAARVALAPRFKKGELGLSALFTRMTAKDAHVQCVLSLKDRPAVRRELSAPLKATRPDSERAVAEAAIPREGLAGGTYVVAVTARDGQGRPLASVQNEVLIPDPPPWLGSKAGITDAVLPPYTPVEMKNDRGAVQLGVWGRSYCMAGHPLPEQIVSRDVPLLAGPVRLRAVVGGKEIAWSEAVPQVRGRTPAHVALEQGHRGGPLSLHCRTRIEYDGLLRADCTLSGDRPVEIQSLTLEVPFPKQLARYAYTWPTSFGSGGFSGQITRPMEFSFHPIVWIGDEVRGLSWMCESENHFLPGDPAKVIGVVPAGEQVTLQVRVIGKPLALRPGRTLEYTFAFQATPLKPMGKDGWELRFSGCPWYGYDYDLLKGREFLGKPGLVRLQELGVRTMIAGNWTPALAYPWPLDRAADFKALVKACHAHGIRVIPYLGYQISEKAPECSCVKDEVVTFPPSANPDKYPGMEAQTVDSVCLRSIWQDALADYVARMMDEFDIDGVYLDSTNMPFPCTSALHGCEARRADGTKAPVYPVFSVRDTFRRLYAVVKGKKADGIVDSHVYDCMNSASLAFSTTYWNGEQLSTADAPTDALPLDRFRAEFLGINWGVPCDVLAYRLGGFNKALAVSLPHDILVRAWQDEIPAGAAVWKLLEDFGRPRARFVPYYDPACPVRGLPKDWIASAYLHPERGALVIVSNLSRQQGRAAWRPDWKALGLDDRTPVLDGLTRRPLVLKDGALEISLPAGAWQYLWFQQTRSP